jgi:hypothetical protein
MAERKRPMDRPAKRLTVEVYDGDEDLVRRARIAALVNAETMRELVIRAVRQEVERLEAGQRRDGAGARR